MPLSDGSVSDDLGDMALADSAGAGANESIADNLFVCNKDKNTLLTYATASIYHVYELVPIGLAVRPRRVIISGCYAASTGSQAGRLFF